MAYESETQKLRRKYEDKPEQWFAALADHFRKGNELDEALRIVRDGLQKRPNYVSGHIVLGRCLVDHGDDHEAESVFEQVLSLDPENIIALRALGEISNRAGDTNGARKWLTRLLEVDPMNPEAQEALDGLQHEDYAPPDAPAVETPAEPVMEAAAVESEAPSDIVAAAEASSPVTGEGPDEDLGDFEIKPYPSYEEAPAASLAPAEGADVDDALEIEHEDVNWSGMTAAPVGEVDVERSDASPWSREEIDAADDADIIDTSADEPQPPSDVLPHEISEALPTLSPDPTGEDFAAGFEPVSLEDLTGDASEDSADEAADEIVSSETSFDAALVGEVPGDAVDAESDGDTPARDDLFEAAFAGEASVDVPDADRSAAETVEADEPEPAAPSTELPLTETMAEVYAKQGLLGEARRVYGSLIEANPHDEALRARMEALDDRNAVQEAPASEEEVPEELALSEGTSVRALFAGLLGARLSPSEASTSAAPTMESDQPVDVVTSEVDVELDAPDPTPSDLTPFESAFVPEDTAPDQQPHYASEDVPLSAILGAGAPAESDVPVETEPTEASHTEPDTSPDGMSFDQFFGSSAPEESPPIAESLESSEPAEEDDEEEFKAWLKSLKS